MTEPTPTPSRSRTRASWAPWAAGLAVLAVGAAGAWLGGGLASDAGPGRPAPLGLTSVAGAGAEPGQAVLADTGAASGRLQLVGPLPDGPDSAAVHRLTGKADSAAVAELATAVSLPGAPHLNGPRWELVDGTRALRVASGAGAQWTYARDVATACLPMPGAGPDEPVSCAAVAVGPAPADGSAPPPPVAPDEAAARAAAAPVLRAVGLDAATAMVTLGGADTLLRADPVVAGLPTVGWSTTVTVDQTGVVMATGWLTTTTQVGDTYPLVTAQAAFDRLAQQPVPMMALACPEPAPGTATGRPSLPGCGGPLTVTGARLGLSLEQSTDGPLLVPAWLFAVEGSSEPLTVIAVEPEFWGSPEDPVPPSTDPGSSGASGSSGSSGGSVGGGAGIEPVPPVGAPGPPVSEPDPTVTLPSTAVSVTSATVGADGRAVELVFWGAPDVDGPCGAAYDVSTTEAPDAVVVAVTEQARSVSTIDRACPAIAAERHVTVTLDTPLADRPLVDAATGSTVPVRR